MAFFISFLIRKNFHAKIFDMKIAEFDILKNLFAKNGHSLYIVGGTSRDLLLGKEPDDLDFVTDATPEEEKTFLHDASYHFAKFGSIHLKVNGKLVDITTFRVEGSYDDHRHPSKISFVRDIKEDYVRRDFTINALYLDKDYKVIDFCNGENDLQNRLIRFIGDPNKRIKEDPLRICRAERFATKLGFSIEKETLEAIKNNYRLLDELNPQKLEEEVRKGWVRK